MSYYQSLCILILIAVTIAFLNPHLLKLQTTIAVTSGALLISILMLVVGKTVWPGLENFAARFLTEIDFKQFVLEGVLGFLLFAGGLGINLKALRGQKWEIAVLVLFGIIASTLLVAIGLWGLTQLLGMEAPFIYCLLFGALISPTDPIAVLAIVKKLDAPEQIAIQVEGESLFNDGIGLVIFLAIYAVAFSGAEATPGAVAELFVHETLGGLLFGAVVGVMAHFMISATDEGHIELALSMCIPTAGFAVANLLGFSGALAMVVAGIILGNWTRYTGFSSTSEGFLDEFWHFLDEFLNALLFLMIGVAMLVVHFYRELLWLIILAIPLVLLSRFLSVALPYLVFRRFRHYHSHSVRILTWGGLRGALSLAMAVSVPVGIGVGIDGQYDLRNVMVAVTYSVVLFSIIVQGMTIAPLILRAKRQEAKDRASETNHRL